jgi:two-component system, sensor histidine kinase and response regulator
MKNQTFTKKDKSILYVDDEEKNLSSFKAVFRKDYKIYIATSAQEGIDIIEREPIHLVISDQRMPNMSGTEFLEKISEKHPDIIRIIITGYSDFDAIINSINRAKVYQYVSKPWKKEDFKQVIDSAWEMYALRQENRNLFDDLKKINSQLDRFIYSAAHDLRSPITTLKGLLNLALQETDMENIQQLLKLKNRTLQKLDHFICEINDYSVNLRSEVQHEVIDFEELIDEMIPDFQHNERYKEVEFIFSLHQPFLCYADKDRLKIILQNLLSNAFNFHNPHISKPFVKLYIEVTASQIVLQVSDNGIGIDAEHLPHIFDMFYRATDQNPGSGLGLYLVKETIYKLQGDVEINSEVNKGSVVKVRIPIDDYVKN